MHSNFCKFTPGVINFVHKYKYFFKYININKFIQQKQYFLTFLLQPERAKLVLGRSKL